MSRFKLSGPPGDPAGLQVAASRVSAAADQVRAAGYQLTTTANDARRAWSGKAQMLFSLLAEGVGELMTGAGGIAAEFGQALSRYSRSLEASQREVQLARERFQAASGPVLQPAVISSSIQQAETAIARAEASARELSARALDLIGSRQSQATTWTSPGDVSVSFVSQAHAASASLVNHGAATSFDIQAGFVEDQLRSTLNALLPGPTKSIAILPSGSSPAYGATAVVLGPQASAVEGSIMLKPGTGVGAGTVLLGPEQPLTTAPGIVIAPGAGSGPPAVVIDLNSPEAQEAAKWDKWVEQQTEEYKEYLDSPEYAANLARNRDGGINESIGDAMSFNAIRNSQEWINRYNNAGAETMLESDLDSSGHIGDI